MTAAWIAAFCALAVTVAALATIMLGLTRRVLEVLLRVEASLASNLESVQDAATGLGTGDPAPPLPSQVVDSASRGDAGSLIVFLEVGCEPCRILAADVARRQLDPAPYRAIVIIDDPRGLHPFPAGWFVTPDPDHTLSRSWRVFGTPIAFLVDAAGVIRGRAFANTVKDLSQLMRDGGDRQRPRQNKFAFHTSKKL